ncbi:hypothetical protein COA01_23085 [Bacillus cereus]|uniref:hypothetical protein n=1 Tax=Bacillus cereus TaxID=1396 RepID=UPI000BFC2E12|nr:hypothetical protein [Bacillus cereus]PGP18630.1 hypothetical protein COA01_23085 [Bacillus cereus]
MKQNIYISGLPKKVIKTLEKPDYIKIVNKDDKTIDEALDKTDIHFLFCWISDEKTLYESLFDIGYSFDRPYRNEIKIIVAVDEKLNKSLQDEIWFGLRMADEIYSTNEVHKIWDRFIKKEEQDRKDRFYYVLEKKGIARIKTIVTEFCNNYVRKHPLNETQINGLDRHQLAGLLLKDRQFWAWDYPTLKEDLAKQIDLRLPNSYLNRKHNCKKEWVNIEKYSLRYQFSENKKPVAPVPGKSKSPGTVKELKNGLDTYQELLSDKQLSFLRILFKNVGLKEIPNIDKLTKGSAGILINYLKGQGYNRLMSISADTRNRLNFVGLAEESTETLFGDEPKHFIPFTSVSVEDKKSILKSWGMNPQKKKFKLQVENQKLNVTLVGFEGLIEKKCALESSDGAIRIMSLEELMKMSVG